MNNHHPTALYPEIEPYRQGTLSLDKIHAMYWEESGNPSVYRLYFFMAVRELEQRQRIGASLIRHIIVLSFMIKEAQDAQHLSVRFKIIQHLI